MSRPLKLLPLAYHLGGARKGQPRICRECGAQACVNPNGYRLCNLHYRAQQRQHSAIYNHRKFLKSIERWLLTPNIGPYHCTNPCDPDFLRLDPGLRQLALQELELILHNHPERRTGFARAQAWGHAVQLALHGGRSQWAYNMFVSRSTRARLINRLNGVPYPYTAKAARAFYAQQEQAEVQARQRESLPYIQPPLLPNPEDGPQTI